LSALLGYCELLGLFSMSYGVDHVRRCAALTTDRPMEEKQTELETENNWHF